MSDLADLPNAYRRVQALDRSRCRPDQIQGPVQAMNGTDVGDLTSMSPHQAVLAAVTLLHKDGFGLGTAIGVWAHGRGVPFALEAFLELGRLDRWSHGTLLDHFASARQLLDLVRSAPDDIHAEAMAIAERLRAVDEPGRTFARTVTTFLFPERSDWLEADLAAAADGELPAAALMPSVATAGQAARIGELSAGQKWTWIGDPAVELAFVQIAGARALPFLLAWFDTEPGGAELRILDLISRLPGDATIGALADAAARNDDHPVIRAHLHAAAERFPDSALRVLAAMAPTRTSTHVLSAVVAAEPDRARAVLPELAPEARTRVETLLSRETPRVAASEQIPAMLLRPPWSDPKAKRPKPAVITGLAPSAGAELVWQPGERERWLGRTAGWEPRQGWPAIAERIAVWRTEPVRKDDNMLQIALYFAANAPSELVLPLLEDGWLPPIRRADEQSSRFAAQYEMQALPTILAIRGRPADRGRLLLPFVDAEIAGIMVESMTRPRSVARGVAQRWLRRHSEAAVRALLPAALGKAGAARRNAEIALRWLAADGTDVPHIADAAHGAEAAVAVKTLIIDDGMSTCPRTMPATPMWAMPSVLPAIRLADGSAVLPPRAVRTVVEMLQISKPEAPHPGLEAVQELCDAASLSGLASALFDNWSESGAELSFRWVLDALGLFGDDSTVDRLAWLVGPESDEGDLGLIGDALTLLGVIGGERALSVLHSVSRRGRSKQVRVRAEQRFQDVAESLDLTAEELADHLVPTLGLGADGTLRLDYGPRSFVVGFDELLRPRLTDETGTVLKRVATPAKTDDQERAKAAIQQYAEVKKEAQKIASAQIRRLAKAMITRRRWTPESFTHLAAHPLLRHIIRRVVWGVYAPDGSPIGSFRIAEDLSYADVHDQHYELPDGAAIGVAHPVELGAVAAEWSELFADYEILQPLDQLGRPALRLTPEERAGWTLDRFHRKILSPNSVKALAARGWIVGPVGDPPVWSRLLRSVDDDRFLVLDIEPGLTGGSLTDPGYQGVEQIWLSEAGNDTSFDLHSVPLSELGAVPASEILSDLTEVTRP
jgi:hypothetical protein